MCIHGASATHYDWPPFLKITGGRWGDETYHGPISECRVQIINKEHPITKGLQDFTIRDELWVNLECCPDDEALCAVQLDGNTKYEPVILITQYGKGRGFYHVLGHDTAAMMNPNWQTLLIRGTKWAAQRKVPTD